MSPLPLLACFLLLGGLILALLYALRRGIQEQEERDAIERELEELEGPCPVAATADKGPPPVTR